MGKKERPRESPSRFYRDAPIGLCYFDRDLRYVHINEWLASANGLAVSEHLGRTIGEVLPDVASGVEEQLRQVIETGEPIEGGTVEGQTPANPGVTRIFEHSFYPVSSTGDAVAGVSCAVQEVTEREAAKTALAAANQELEAFADSIAHDLKTPLLTVTNFSQYLRESLGNKLNEEQDDYLHRVERAGRRMRHLIDDLRDLADVKGVEITRSKIDLSALGREIIDDLRALVPDRDVRFEVAPGIQADGDSTLLRVLLTNLLQNAWKYTGPSEGAWIELGVAEDDGDVPIYHVRDNGIGFDKTDDKTIFQAFKRLHTKEEFTGSGLGLATVERIVHRHGGRIWAEGAPGEGAVFRFTLGPEHTEILAARQGA